MSSRLPDDAFSRRAKREDFLARSVYKLEEIDRREQLLVNVGLILDLGASPGSWVQYCVKRCPSAKIVAVDLSLLRVSHPKVTFVQGDVRTVDWQEILGGQKVDIVLSDMAPKTSGIHHRDVALSNELAQLALDIAKHSLKKEGKLVVKLFMGEGFTNFEKLLREQFTSVRILRPESTRKRSREVYFIGRGFLAS